MQERGLYFLGEKDPKYIDLVSMVDPFKDNPGEKLGSLVEAKYGKGRWLYLGLGLWRQLPAGTSWRLSVAGESDQLAESAGRTSIRRLLRTTSTRVRRRRAKRATPIEPASRPNTSNAFSTITSKTPKRSYSRP